MLNSARNRVAPGGNDATVMPPETAKAPALEAPRPSELNQRGRRHARMPSIAGRILRDGGARSNRCVSWVSKLPPSTARAGREAWS